MVFRPTLAVLWLFVPLFWGCSLDSKPLHCGENETRDCECADGRQGVRTCVEGTFGECVCADGLAGDGAGGSGGDSGGGGEDSEASGTGGGGNGGKGNGGGGNGGGGNGGGGSGGAGSGGGGDGGGGDGGAGSGGAGSGGDIDCSAQPLPDDLDDVISTFEDRTGAVQQVAGRGGGFYMFNDGTGTQTPAPNGLPDAVQMDRCDSLYALCTSGEGFTDWGAGMGTDLGPTTGAGDGGVGEKSTYDASGYSGVAFWAKAGEGATTVVRVSVKDANTAPEGGVCDPDEVSGAAACNDDWGKSINLTEEWKPYTILFSELRQSGWGMVFPEFDVEHTYSIQFQVGPSVPFDFCIDDLVFVK
jgi:hypothetical protein